MHVIVDYTDLDEFEEPTIIGPFNDAIDAINFFEKHERSFGNETDITTITPPAVFASVTELDKLTKVTPWEDLDFYLDKIKENRNAI